MPCILTRAFGAETAPQHRSSRTLSSADEVLCCMTILLVTPNPPLMFAVKLIYYFSLNSVKVPVISSEHEEYAFECGEKERKGFLSKPFS